MANLKHLKTRISSIKSTSKITQAMKVVSASKLKKARDATESNRPYAEEMRSLMASLLKQIPYKEQIPLVYGREKKIKNYLIIVIGSERGLCGSFNSGLAKIVKQKVEELSGEGQNIRVECIGNKVHTLLKYMINTQSHLIHSSNNLQIEEVKLFAKNLLSSFSEEGFDVCLVFYNKFISAMTREVKIQKLLPLYDSEEAGAENDLRFECEPEPELMFKDLVQDFAVGSITSMLCETIASEHGARMTSMDNATRNAGEMIKKLVMLYNRTRQAAVTTELIEIISGAEAMKV